MQVERLDPEEQALRPPQRLRLRAFASEAAPAWCAARSARRDVEHGEREPELLPMHHQQRQPAAQQHRYPHRWMRLRVRLRLSERKTESTRRRAGPSLIGGEEPQQLILLARREQRGLRARGAAERAKEAIADLSNSLETPNSRGCR
eukprot:1893697-Prymnesium_polylepis.1